MSRQIKFRAWQDNEMLTQPCSGVYAMKRLFGLLYEDTDLMQFTGLKDKNGKEIYEGDVCGSQYFTPSTVLYCEENAEFIFCDISYYEMISAYPDMQLSVLGNIYENPELKT